MQQNPKYKVGDTVRRIEDGVEMKVLDVDRRWETPVLCRPIGGLPVGDCKWYRCDQIEPAGPAKGDGQ